MPKLHRRSASLQQPLILVGGSLAAIVVLIVLLIRTGDIGSRPNSGGPAKQGTEHDPNRTLVMYCAAGIKGPVEAVANQYEREFGVTVQLQYGGSGTLLSNLQVSRTGDLYLAADASYLELAQDRELIDEVLPLATLRATIAVRRGNPKQIASLRDLLRDDVTFGLANPDAASVGKLTKSVLEQHDLWEPLSERAKVFKPTVNEVANDLKLGAVDAGIIWDATARQYPEFELVTVPEFEQTTHAVQIGVLRNCTQPAAALHFARYLGARDRGLLEFEKRGFEPAEGDIWADVPEITLFSGGINRLAIEETLQSFQEREGVRVNVVYNGCGILVGMMRSGQQPDAYFACDTPYMSQVADAFLEPFDISESPVVVLVKADNPWNVHSLEDLTQAGLKLGVANEEQSALGALTARLFAEAGLSEAIADNIRTRVPTADLLVNQMRTGSLDAAIVYLANTVHIGPQLEVVRLKNSAARAVQPIAVGRHSDHRHLSSRLVNAIDSADSRKRFESSGFLWRGEPVQE